MNISLTKSPSTLLPPLFWTLFLIVALSRLLGAFFLPVIDPSEARYAEIARKMVETGDWITLYHNYGVPFWAKPPLSTWLSSLGMTILGINELGGRLPIFLVSLATLGLVVHLGSTRHQKDLSYISALVLFSSVLFYIATAAIMTDMPLVFGITLSMVAFWHTLNNHNPKLWKYLFFVGQAIGLLAKGPVCLALSGLPLCVWVLSTRTFKKTWQGFPWVWGSLLTFAIAGPWYVLAELKTPGFLDYFIGGEHFKRFLVKGWDGDLYGNAHAKPLGFIWLYWAGSTFPWILWFISSLVSKRHQIKYLFTEDKFYFYLLLWALFPLLFFTFSRNIIWTYVLPGLPAFSILVGLFIHQAIQASRALWCTFIGSVLLVPVVMLGLLVYSYFVPEALNNQRRLVEEFQATYPKSSLIYYCPNCYSAEFYSHRKAPLVHEEKELEKFLDQGAGFVAIRERKVKELPPILRAKLREVKQYGSTILFEIDPSNLKDNL